jgi:pyrroloquinoline quinone biosynthesis protein B
VPHRDEWSDTVAFRVVGPRRTLLYLPDVDKWEKWDRRLEDEVQAVDVALLDGTFESEAELGGRSLLEIPHPLVGETVRRLEGRSRATVAFIHLNHTNRLIAEEEAVLRLRARGFEVARDGQEFPL